MSFNFYLFKGIRFLLFPISILTWVYLRVRNWLYNTKLVRSTSFNLPIICVGNLSVGGTGKSPMVEYLLCLLSTDFEIGVVSRGYKRKTKGYLLASAQTTALEIGDEPMQFHVKFPQAAVAVGEERIVTVPQLLHDRPGIQAIIMDDAFQHRAITAGLSIVLTDYNNPYWFDFYLPTGELRDNKRSAKRAQIIIVTKCPQNLSEAEKNTCLENINPQKEQQVFFTAIEYGAPYHIVSKEKTILDTNTEVLLVCGIANPLPLKKYLEEVCATYLERSFSDHHIFTIDDWREIENKFTKLDGSKNLILTTEKDAVRLEKFSNLLIHKPLYVLPIVPKFLFEEAGKFDNTIKSFIENFGNNDLDLENDKLSY